MKEAVVSARVGYAERDALARRAALYDRTISAEVRRAVNQYLQREDAAGSGLAQVPSGKEAAAPGGHGGRRRP
jgi:hypothetical protein